MHKKIPFIYQGFTQSILDVDIPEENIATCDSCVRCRAIQSPFSNTKCCDYHPSLANYLVGGILSNPFPYGQTQIREKMAKKEGVSPYGISTPIPYSNSRKAFYAIEQEFHKVARQQAESLLCPYYDQGNCSIWAFRANLCVTYFCASTGGIAGKQFWKKVNNYLSLAEKNLSKYAMLQLGWSAASLDLEALYSSAIHPEDAAGQISEQKYRDLWQHWLGREEEFYIACYEVIRQLDRETFQQIMGQDGAILEAAIQETAQVFRDSVIPDHLVLHPDVKIEASATAGYNLLCLGENQVEVPGIILPLVKAFNGQRSIFDVFDLGFKVMYNLSSLVDELWQKGLLIRAEELK